MDAIAKLEAHYRLKLPAGYRDWTHKGYTDVRNLDDGPDGYLWVNEAEWIPPDEIPACDLWRTNIIPGLIPFAFSGAGDHWCWNTRVNNGQGEYEVLYCWHDEDLADAYAPTFPAWFYRNCLTYAANLDSDDSDEIHEARGNLRLWSRKFSEIHYGDWIDHLASLSEVPPFEYHDPKLRKGVDSLGFITSMEVDQIVANQFGQRYLAQKVSWGTWPE
jgi:hypothetical protein